MARGGGRFLGGASMDPRVKPGGDEGGWGWRCAPTTKTRHSSVLVHCCPVKPIVAVGAGWSPHPLIVIAGLDPAIHGRGHALLRKRCSAALQMAG